jgi:hypothetical protein
MKSLYNPLLELFRMYARPPITKELILRVNHKEAEYIQTSKAEQMQLHVTSEAPRDDFGTLWSYNGSGILVHLVDCDSKPSGAVQVTNYKVHNWLNKVDREAIAGKRMASFELLSGPFSFFYNTKRLPKVSGNNLIKNISINIEEIIKSNRQKGRSK